MVSSRRSAALPGVGHFAPAPQGVAGFAVHPCARAPLRKNSGVVPPLGSAQTGGTFNGPLIRGFRDRNNAGSFQATDTLRLPSSHSPIRQLASVLRLPHVPRLPRLLMTVARWILRMAARAN
jgi:hypothetical protein